MKSIAIKVTTLVFAFAASFSAIACDPSNKMANHDTDMLSKQQIELVQEQFREASF